MKTISTSPPMSCSLEAEWGYFLLSEFEPVRCPLLLMRFQLSDRGETCRKVADRVFVLLYIDRVGRRASAPPFRATEGPEEQPTMGENGSSAALTAGERY
jgi:hypothetical protein